MQKFLEYLSYMLNFSGSNLKEEIQARVLEEITKRMSELSIEELECLDGVFDAYELYFQQESNAVDKLIETINGYDNKNSILAVFSYEISRLVKQKEDIESKVALFAKVCDLANQRISQLSR